MIRFLARDPLPDEHTRALVSSLVSHGGHSRSRLEEPTIALISLSTNLVELLRRQFWSHVR